MSDQVRIIVTTIGESMLTITTNRPISAQYKTELFCPPITRQSSEEVLKKIGPAGRILVKTAYKQEGVKEVFISRYEITVVLEPAFFDDMPEMTERLIKVIKIVLSSPSARWEKISSETMERGFVTKETKSTEVKEVEPQKRATWWSLLKKMFTKQK